METPNDLGMFSASMVANMQRKIIELEEQNKRLRDQLNEAMDRLEDLEGI